MASLGYKYASLGPQTGGGLGSVAISPYDFNFVAPVDQTGASMQPYEPSFRERIGNWIYDTAQGYGLPANRMRNEAETAMDFVPVLGDAVGFDEANRDVASGHPVLGGIGYGAAALGMVPMVGDALQGGVKKGIRAFHGSPHDFDRFSLDKIGTGEGAQAYGHGLYFAQNEDVARGYRESLSNGANVGGRGHVAYYTTDSGEIPTSKRAEAQIAYTMHQFGIDPNTKEGKSWLSSEIGARNMTAPKNIKKADVLSFYNGPKITENHANGRMYEVNIDANPEDFLDWDKPLSAETPEGVRDAFNSLANSRPDIKDKFHEEYRRGAPGYIYYSILNDAAKTGNLVDNQTAASDALRAAGIPGIRYNDEGSRRNFYVSENIVKGGKQDGWRVDSGDERHWGKFKTEKEARDFVAQKDAERTSNYVVFDENLISIVRKYGVAGALAAGLLTQQQAEEMSAQGYI